MLRPPSLLDDFWEYPPLREALAARHFGHVLRAYRTHPSHGRQAIPQQVVAHWLGLTQPQLSRFENGTPPSDLDRLTLWAKTIGIPERLLWFRLPADSRSPIKPTSKMSADPRPSRAAGGSVADLAAMQSFRLADRKVGGGYLYATVARYLQHWLSPRLFGTQLEPNERGVFSAAAAMTEMAGWMAHDADRDELAQQHFHRALGMARISNDRQLCAHIYGSLSHLAHHRGQPGQGIAYARQGQAQVVDGDGLPPSLRARLCALEARGHAAQSDEQEAHARLRTAEHALSQDWSGPVSPWVNQFDEASLAVEMARCFHALGRTDAVRREVDRVIRLRPPDRVRSRALAQLVAASALANAGKIDAACVVTTEVMEATGSLGSYLIVRQLAEVGRVFQPHRRRPAVAAFLDRLAAELYGRRWIAQSLPQSARESSGQP